MGISVMLVSVAYRKFTLTKECFMSVHQHNDGRWIVVYRDTDGKRHDKSFGRGEQGQLAAESFDMAMKSRYLKVSSDIGNMDMGICLENAVNLYCQHLSASGKTERHIRDMRYIAERVYYPFWGRAMPLKMMTYTEHIVPFINHLKETISPLTKKRRNSITINKYCSYLRSVFNFMITQGYLQESPMRFWRKMREEPRRFQLTLDDVKKIMEVADEHVRLAIEVAYNIGVRPGESELFALKWTDVDFVKGQISVFGRKTNKLRVVPVKPAFLKRLEAERAKSRCEYIISYNAKPVTRINKAFKRAAERAGINYPVRMYDLRHMFATNMLAHGGDLAAVSKLLGHSSVTMTADVYYQYLEGEKERAINLLPDIPA